MVGHGGLGACRLQRVSRVLDRTWKPVQKSLRSLKSYPLCARRKGAFIRHLRGFQHIILEFARNVLGIADAAHAESDPSASRLVISKLACSLVGRSLAIKLVEPSLVSSLY